MRGKWALVVVPIALVVGCGSSSGPGSVSGDESVIESQQVGTATFPQSFATARDGAGCTMALSGDTTSTTASFTMGESGELISHVAGPGGDIGRHDDQVTPGSGPVYTYSYPPSDVGDVGAILYLADGSEVGCTITQQ